jgi:hypothetical protein
MSVARSLTDDSVFDLQCAPQPRATHQKIHRTATSFALCVPCLRTCWGTGSECERLQA